MSRNNVAHLGPVRLCTLVAPDLGAAIAAYRDSLHTVVAEQTQVSGELAELWGSPTLCGSRMALLANACGEVWLRIVEDIGCPRPTPLQHHGWLALELLVADVDVLAAELADSAFTLLRPPANLDLSDSIRACQVSGPCGEVLYLTQVKAPVPPFDLPQARCAVDRLFIPIICTPDRQAAADFYARLAGVEPLFFTTKITVLNQAYSWNIDRQHPVATLQLAGQCLLEIDQIEAASHRVCPPGRLPPGIAVVSVAVVDIERLAVDWKVPPRPVSDAPYGGKKVGLVRGAAGEWLELIET
ncbi:MAG: hypothetical protein GDA55_02755 [Cellvibrionales bacterium]|nr:hypothetical protein [Cellvibrionales bacterium]